MKKRKHIKIDCHFVPEKVLSIKIITEPTSSKDQLAYFFTKSPRGLSHYICCNLGAYDLFTPDSGSDRNSGSA